MKLNGFRPSRRHDGGRPLHETLLRISPSTPNRPLDGSRQGTQGLRITRRCVTTGRTSSLAGTQQRIRNFYTSHKPVHGDIWLVSRRHPASSSSTTRACSILRRLTWASGTTRKHTRRDVRALRRGGRRAAESFCRRECEPEDLARSSSTPLALENALGALVHTRDASTL